MVSKTNIDLTTDKLIVFDIDGTLTDSADLHQKAFTEVLLEMGVKNVGSEFGGFKHHTDSFIAKEIYEVDTGNPFTSERLAEFEKGLAEKMGRESITEIPGANALIRKLQLTPEYGLCFATGSLRRPAEHKLASIGVTFESWQLATSDHILDREGIVSQAIRNAREHYQVQAFQQILSVGDGLWDLLTAQNLGVEFVGVGERNRKVLLQNGAPVVYRDLTEFAL